MMFTKFGEMNSYKEINELAENLFNEGDIKSPCHSPHKR